MNKLFIAVIYHHLLVSSTFVMLFETKGHESVAFKQPEDLLEQDKVPDIIILGRHAGNKTDDNGIKYAIKIKSAYPKASIYVAAASGSGDVEALQDLGLMTLRLPIGMKDITGIVNNILMINDAVS
jgi:hypothetical protein